MEQLDYHTVMESRIKYYALKYDPQNKLANLGTQQKRRIKPEPVSVPVAETKIPVKRRLQKKLDSVIAMFL